MSCKECKGEAHFASPIGDLYCSAECCEKVTKRPVRISTETSSFLDVHQDDPIIGVFRSEPSLLKAHDLSCLEEARSGPSHYKLHRALVGVARAVQMIGPLKEGEEEKPAASSSKRLRDEEEPTSRKAAAPLPPNPLEMLSLEMRIEIIKQLEITDWEPLFKINTSFTDMLYNNIGYLLTLKGFKGYKEPLRMVINTDTIDSSTVPPRVNISKWRRFTINAILKEWKNKRPDTVHDIVLISMNVSDRVLDKLALAKDWVNFEFMLRLPLSDTSLYFDITSNVHAPYLVYEEDPERILPVLFWYERNRKPPDVGIYPRIMNDWFIPAFVRRHSLLYRTSRDNSATKAFWQWKGQSGSFLDIGAYFKYKMPSVLQSTNVHIDLPFFADWRGPTGEYIDFTDEAILKFFVWMGGGDLGTLPKFLRDWTSPTGKKVDPMMIGEIYLKMTDRGYMNNP